MSEEVLQLKPFGVFVIVFRVRRGFFWGNDLLCHCLHFHIQRLTTRTAVEADLCGSFFNLVINRSSTLYFPDSFWQP